MDIPVFESEIALIQDDMRILTGDLEQHTLIDILTHIAELRRDIVLLRSELGAIRNLQATINDRQITMIEDMANHSVELGNLSEQQVAMRRVMGELVRR